MALLWHEKILILQQTDPRLRLAPDAMEVWAGAVRGWLAAPDYALFVAIHEQTLVGYVIARADDAAPGLLPARIGVILDMAIGVHSRQNGLGSRLLEPVRQWFAEQGLSRFIVYTAHRAPVEQAFWRALGGTQLTDVLWMKV